MDKHTDPGTEIWRPIVVRRSGSEFLVLEDEAGFRLPNIEIPRGTRVALELNAHLKAVWDLESFSLYALQTKPVASDRLNPRYYAVESVAHDADTIRSGRWLDMCSSEEVHFDDIADLTAIRQWREDVVHSKSNGNQSAFGTPGSLTRIREWVQDSLLAYRLRLTGRFSQFNAGKTFGLIRFETDNEAVWFKAVAPPNQREFPLTVALCQRLPAHTPELLATRPRWNAWLTREAAGPRLSQCRDITPWSNAARDLAAFQISSVGATDCVLQCGGRDLRPQALRELIGPFFESLGELMDRQTCPVPRKLSPEELVELQRDIHTAIHVLHEADVPISLGHLDLNPENIIALPDRTVFLDWAEAAVGHPFLSLAYLIEHCRQSFDARSDCTTPLVRAYLNRWNVQGLFKNPEKLLCLALLLAVLAHAVSTEGWRNTAELQDPSVAGYYRSLARRMKAYADPIRERDFSRFRTVRLNWRLP
ncbi:MAG TPA: phosphotransferase [Candidatus Acidoferrum sp.]|nr:phosphotransferase [Candidatus Acidoferrum sp.]